MASLTEQKHGKSFTFQGREYFVTDMHRPSFNELLANPRFEDLDNKFDIILLATVKAKQIRRRIRNAAESELPRDVELKPLTMALQDIARGNISDEEIELLKQKQIPSLEYQVLRSMTSQEFLEQVVEQPEEEEAAEEEEVEVEATVPEGEMHAPALPELGPDELEEQEDERSDAEQRAAEKIFGEGSDDASSEEQAVSLEDIEDEEDGGEAEAEEDEG